MILMETGNTGEEAARLAVVGDRVSRHVTYREILLLHRLKTSKK